MQRGLLVRDSKQSYAGPTAAKVSQLTPREREVLQFLASGKRCKDVAVVLNISVNCQENPDYTESLQAGAANSSCQPLPWPISHVARLPSSSGPLRISFAWERRLHFGPDFYSLSLSPSALFGLPQSLPVLPLKVFLWFPSVFRMSYQMPRGRR
jgi:Bacterial regulatory proteins, luxR family